MRGLPALLLTALAASFVHAPLARADAGTAGAATGPLGDAGPPSPSAAAAVAAGAGGAPSLDAGAAPAAAEAPRDVTCQELLGDGARPRLSERLPERGIAGHTIVLELGVDHGAGERVLPGGLHVDTTSEGSKALEAAGFVLPHPDGGAGPTLVRQARADGVRTTLEIPLLLLPSKPGRQELRLPPLPISIARASGAVVTLCTQPHRVVVDDPIANEPNAAPHDNPSPERQLESWTLARRVAEGVVAALLALALGALLLRLWQRRPRQPPPPQPSRPPWESALEALERLRLERLPELGRHAEHYERVAHVMRAYLGERYGYDGLESTTRESLGYLRRISPSISVLPELEGFLNDADLVKFARLTPTDGECQLAMSRAEALVRRTIPGVAPGTTPEVQP